MEISVISTSAIADVTSGKAARLKCNRGKRSPILRNHSHVEPAVLLTMELSKCFWTKNAPVTDFAIMAVLWLSRNGVWWLEREAVFVATPGHTPCSPRKGRCRSTRSRLPRHTDTAVPEVATSFQRTPNPEDNNSWMLSQYFYKTLWRPFKDSQLFPLIPTPVRHHVRVHGAKSAMDLLWGHLRQQSPSP